MPINDLVCKTAGCEQQDVLIEDELHGFTPEGDVDQICAECGKALRVQISKVNIVSDRRKGVTRLKNGLEVTSPDRSVCNLGRTIVGETTTDIVKPGETRVLESGAFGATVAVTRSPGGGNISVVRADK